MPRTSSRGAGAPVVFDGVWKKFRTGERHDSLRDLIPATAKRLLGRRASGSEITDQEFWALEDISFEVAPGEALGIIGPNGAGKSTILKLLTKILRPNRGTSLVRGRVGALIEIAAGFHPDLTGRENVYLQGAIMGMSRADIARRFDDIVEFAGVGGFIDTQIKRYSSGMNARLGFSIAAHLDPDVLIIDEVLSVGDVAFQQRCVDRMRQFKREGVTIVFVSHNLQAVSELCDRALYLKRRIRELGPVTATVQSYLSDSFSATSPAADQAIAIRAVELQTRDGQSVEGAVAPGDDLQLVVEFETARPLADLNFAFRVLRSTDQLLVYDGHFPQDELRIDLSEPMRFTISYGFSAHLTRGQYYFDVFAQDNPTQRFLARLVPAGHLTVSEMRTWGGVADLDVEPSVASAVAYRRAFAGTGV